MHMSTVRRENDDRIAFLIEDRLNQACASVGSGPLRAAMMHSIEGGKRIRPRLTVLACAAAGGRGQEALDPATAIELLHAASLVHDDIMDRSDLRRGRPTLHALHGIPAAILAGDALVGVAFRLLASAAMPNRQKILAEFAAAYVHLCEGQSGDIGFADSFPLDVPGHRRMVRKKTAELLGAALAIGAMVATADESVCASLRRYGLQLGMAYQAKDDLLELTGTEVRMGKRPGTDLRNGRTTFLTMAYPETDSIAAVSGLIREHTASALRELDSLQPTPARRELEMVATLLVQRER